MIEEQAYQEACVWVSDEIEKTTCISDDDAINMGMGFVSGMLHGMRKGSLGQNIIQGDTAEAFWRGNWNAALNFEREHIMESDNES